MTKVEHHIIEFAKESGVFSPADLYNSSMEISRQYMQWSLVQLVSKGAVVRVKRGLYKLAEKPQFSYRVKEDTRQLHSLLKEAFPYAPFCIYDGEILSPLQHHLSYNTLTYVETDKSVAEAAFHTLQEKEYKVFYKPGKDEFYKYIDISMPAIIVKPMVSDSPLTTVEGVPGPTLEKLLVDIFGCLFVLCFFFFFPAIILVVIRVFSTVSQTLSSYHPSRHARHISFE